MAAPEPTSNLLLNRPINQSIKQSINTDIPTLCSLEYESVVQQPTYYEHPYIFPLVHFGSFLAMDSSFVGRTI
jgi:hypothetical protein